MRLRRRPTIKTTEPETSSGAEPTHPLPDRLCLSPADVKALLWLMVEAQLALQGDQRRAGAAALSAAGWTAKLAQVLDRIGDGHSTHADSTATAIATGLQDLADLAAAGALPEAVVWANGGPDRIADHARSFNGAHRRCLDGVDGAPTSTTGDLAEPLPCAGQALTRPSVTSTSTPNG